MPTRYYRDFIKVDPDFIPVFSRNSDRVYPDKWKSFYPHDDFKRILTGVIETLEQSSETKNRSIWMSGAYGTGKTYASFTIKHILEDPLENVAPYLDANNMQSLLIRLQGVRSKGDVLVVHQSASADINSQNKLFGAIMEAIKETLRAKGYAYLGANSMADKILATLKDPNSAFNFRGAFQKYRSRFLEYASPESVIRDLEELDLPEKLDLLDTVIGVAEAESYNWSISSAELTDWLEDVRKGNGLYAIVFIWDEFTEYFKNNQNRITGFQEIAMASSRIGFYFFLITHSDMNQLIADTNARKILEARFKRYPIKMEENTAFKLMGQALRHERDLAQEWEFVCGNLLGDVKRDAIKGIIKRDPSVSEQDFVKLFPMQPYVAYLLKYIAQDISSNQRTMFQFLSGDYTEGDAERRNFRWFLDNVGFEYGQWNFQTADFLWDYFFYAENVDLENSFMNAISHYNNFETLCENKWQKRVLKVALLLNALHEKNGGRGRAGATSLLRPTLQNVSSCFAGTPSFNEVKPILDILVSKGILGSIEDANDTLYVMNSVQMDPKRLKELEEQARNAFSFNKLIADPLYKIGKDFEPTGFMKYRCQVVNLSANVSTPSAYRSAVDAAEDKPNVIPVFYLFAKNESDQGNVSAIADYVFQRFPNHCILVDFTAQPFTDALYEKFIQNKAKERYFQSIPNQKDQQTLAKQASEQNIQAWVRQLPTAVLSVFRSPNQSETLSGARNLLRKLREYDDALFDAGMESVSENDNLFKPSNYKEIPAKAAMGQMAIPHNYAWLCHLSNNLEQEGLWNASEYWKTKPNHPVSQMKRRVNEIADAGFSKSSAVRFSDIWNALQEPPFGLLPCAGSVFLLGFLLREYADAGYYKRDINHNTVSLTCDVLSDLILGVVKDLPKGREQFLVRQKPEHIAFCDMTGRIFKIPKDKRNSIDDIAKNLNLFLISRRYPLWSLRYYIEEAFHDDENCVALRELVDCYCEFVNPQSAMGKDKTKLAEDIYSRSLETPGLDALMEKTATDENFRMGMQFYIAQYKPELIQIVGVLKVRPTEYLSALLEKLSPDSSYLWKMGAVNAQIDALYEDFRLINALNRILTTKQKTYAAVKNALSEKLNVIKIPGSLLSSAHPELQGILQQLYAVRKGVVADKAGAASVIERQADLFLSFFERQFEDFSGAVLTYVAPDASAEELDYLYQNVASGALFMTVDEFQLNTKRTLEDYRKNRKIEKMFAIWKEKTGTASPAEWSKVCQIPVLCMFDEEIVPAQKTFDALNRTTRLPTETDIDASAAFLESGTLDRLKDERNCLNAFIRHFCGDFDCVIKDTDADALRAVLRRLCGEDVYAWYAAANRTACKNAVRELAIQCYREKFRPSAKEKIRSMSEREAQTYLEELVDQDPLFGIRILRSSSS